MTSTKGFHSHIPLTLTLLQPAAFRQTIMTPVLIKDLDVQKLKFGAPKPSRNHPECSFAAMLYPGHQRLWIETPTVTLPYGISAFQSKFGPARQERSVEIPIPKEPAKREEGVQIILDKFDEVDDYVLHAAVDNAKEWGLKPTARKTIETYRGQAKSWLIKDKKNGDQKVYTKLKEEEEGEVIVIDEGDNSPSAVNKGLDYVTRGTKARLVYEMASVYLMADGFGTSLKLKKVLVVELGATKGPARGGAEFADDPLDN